MKKTKFDFKVVKMVNFTEFSKKYWLLKSRWIWTQNVSTFHLHASLNSFTGWSRKIETVKFGCVYGRGRIRFKISMCKIRLIILHSKYPIPFQIIKYTRDFYYTSKLKVRPLCAMPHFLSEALWEIDNHWYTKKFMLHFECMIQGFFWHIGSNFIMLGSRAISKSLSSQKSEHQIFLVM